MKNMMKKCIAVLLVLAIALSSTGCVAMYIAAELISRQESPSAAVTPYLIEAPVQTVPGSTDWMNGESDRPEVRFSDMEYRRPDTDAIYDAIEQLQSDLESGEFDADTLIARYQEVLDLYDAADSQCSLAYVLYAMDVTEPYYQDEYNALTAALNDIDLSLTDVSIALFEDQESGADMTDRFGKSFEDAVYAGESLNSPEIQTDMEEENRLSTQYDTLLTTFTLKEGGREYTMEDIAAISEQDYSEYVRLFDAYYASLNAQAGDIFLKLVKIRTRIAKTLGYESYADYMYDCYGRDFTTEDARALHAAVKEYLAPLFERTTLDYYGSYGNNYYEQVGAIQAPMDSFVSRMRNVLAEFSPKVLEALDYLLRNELYTATVSDKKMETSFTTYFESYQSPFIFMQWTDDESSASTLIHELGHFANFFQNPSAGWNASDSLDIAEIDSQGLEMLMTAYYEELFGDAATAVRSSRLADGLYSVITGCMEDEFQQEVYANPDMSLEEMNALYARLGSEYKIGDLYGYTGREWVAIPHTFQSPLYYISYAVSMLPALELFVLADEDFEAASAAYHAILMRPEYSALRTITEENGLRDPIEPGSIERLSEELKRILRK